MGEDNILTKFRAIPMHVVHVHERARGQSLANFRLMRLKICRSVFIGDYNMLTKLRANLMHVVHVHECARKLFWAIFSKFQGY